MTDQPSLFDVKRLGPIVCPACQATLNPDETTAPACTADRDREALGLGARRPAGCLNTYTPETARIPY